MATTGDHEPGPTRGRAVGRAVGIVLLWNLLSLVVLGYAGALLLHLAPLPAGPDSVDGNAFVGLLATIVIIFVPLFVLGGVVVAAAVAAVRPRRAVLAGTVVGAPMGAFGALWVGGWYPAAAVALLGVVVAALPWLRRGGARRRATRTPDS